MKTRAAGGALLTMTLALVPAENRGATDACRGPKPVRYVQVDPGTLGGRDAFPRDMNERGELVGLSDLAPQPDGSTPSHAFLWDGERMVDLGTLGGSFSDALAINDRGQVVGTSTTASGETQAFLWDRGQMVDVGTLGGRFFIADDVNKFGQVAGGSNSESSPGSFRSLG